MYRIYICDDEPWALRDICGIIDWSEYGFEEVRTFSEPQTALAAILENAPDAVITDVRMQGMTGLELIERCRAAGSTAVFSVVSAYAEFEYAQRAMASGASSYLLKPLDRNEVSSFARKLAATLHEQRTQRLGQSLRALVLRTLTFDHIGTALPLTETDLFTEPYRIAIAGSAPETTNVAWFRIYNDLYISVLPERCAGGYSFAPPALHGLSRGARSAEQAGQQIWEALIAYYSGRFYASPSRMRRTVDSCIVYRETDAPRGAESDICSAMARGDAGRARSLLSSYEESALARSAMLSELLHFYNYILDGTFRLFPRRDVQETLHTFRSCFHLYGVMHDADTFFESIRLLLEDCFCQESEEEPGGGTMEDVIRFVDSHYQETLTLEMLSERFHISLSHLCRQFKQILNRTFTEYVAQKRVGRACELLRQTRLPVSEIGEQVGYTDYFYFSRVFKKIAGLSPSTYRKGEDHA